MFLLQINIFAFIPSPLAIEYTYIYPDEGVRIASSRRTPEISGIWKQHFRSGFSGDFLPTFCSFPPGKSEDFQSGILLPCFTGFRRFPAGLGEMHSLPEPGIIDGDYLTFFDWSIMTLVTAKRRVPTFFSDVFFYCVNLSSE
jgi:hypothetical protein